MIGGALVVAAALLSVGGGGASADPGRDAGAPDGGQGDASVRALPDPPALVEQIQWVFDLRWDRGEPYLVAIDRTDMGAPRATPRVMGRFALELFEGPALVERARFDFPMLGAHEPDAGRRGPPTFEPKLRTRIGVLFPATARGTALELVDRATGRRWPLPWPPEPGVFGAPAPADAGVDGARP